LTDLIDFHFEDIAHPSFFDDVKAILWIDKIVEKYNSKIIGINYIFCSDEYLLDINKTHLNHDYYTDIITFPYREGKEIESDIFISLDRVADNAQAYGVTYEQELLRVIAHGVLHLVGFKDKSSDDEKAMRIAEDEAIALYN
jgi:probable rRNA maturation factor